MWKDSEQQITVSASEPYSCWYVLLFICRKLLLIVDLWTRTLLCCEYALFLLMLFSSLPQHVVSVAGCLRCGLGLLLVKWGGLWFLRVKRPSLWVQSKLTRHGRVSHWQASGRMFLCSTDVSVAVLVWHKPQLPQDKHSCCLCWKLWYYHSGPLHGKGFNKSVFEFTLPTLYVCICTALYKHAHAWLWTCVRNAWPGRREEWPLLLNKPHITLYEVNTAHYHADTHLTNKLKNVLTSLIYLCC